MTGLQLLAGRYELGEILGTGGMSEVFRGRDTVLGRDVAVKLMRRELARDENFYQRFRREAQNSASLGHPSIVSIYDTGEESTPDGDLPYIVMELVEGDTIRDLVRLHGAMDPQQALGVMADVCGAIDFSHRKGIIHRDVKPANIMITRDGAVKVMDFGIARAVSESTSTLTQTSAVLGTAQYLSPEQARGESVDPRSDVYSAGCVLYEMLTGRPPFTGESPVAVAYQHVREDPRPPSSVNPALDRYVDAIVMQAMAKNPENRYATAGDMRTDLINVLSGQRPRGPLVLTDDELDESQRPEADHGFRGAGYGGGHTAWGTGPLALGAGAAGLGAGLGAGAAAGDAARGTGSVDSSDAPTEMHELPAAGTPSGAAAAGGATAGSAGSAGLTPRTGGRRRRTGRRRPAVIAGAALLAIALAAGIGWFATRDGEEPADDTPAVVEEVTVPELAQRPITEVVPQLEQLGLRVVQQPQPDPHVAAGLVVSSDPVAGKRLAKGSEIHVVVSTGKPILSVPNVMGMSPADAQKTLQDAGFQVAPQTASRPSTQEDAGKVVSTDPGPGAQVPSDRQVTLTVGSGPEEVTVPGVVGQNVEQARATLQAAGFQVDTTQIDGSEPAGQVVQQSTRAGTQQIKGATISLQVSAGNRFQVPNLVNMNATDAMNALRKAGWKGANDQLVQLPQNDPDLSRVGKIHSQQPSPGEAGVNDQIIIRVYRFGLVPGPG